MAVDEHVADLLPAYALDCLEEDEVVRIAGHLKDCAYCRDELRAYQAVADLIPLGVQDINPPARLKSKLMARLNAGAPQKSKAPATESWLERLIGMVRQIAPVWTPISLLLVAVLITTNILAVRQGNLVNPPQTQSLKVIHLTGTEVDPQGRGVMVLSIDGEYGTLVVDNLPKLTTGHQYQLWLIKDGKRTSGGVFSVKDGYGGLWIAAPDPLASYSAVGITEEPAGGSPGPTGRKVLGGNLYSPEGSSRRRSWAVSLALNI